YTALGICGRVQHAVSDQPLHARETSKRGAVEPACASRRVFIRLGARAKDCSNDESRALVCRGELASSGGSDRASEQRSGTIHWRASTIAFVSSRPHTIIV